MPQKRRQTKPVAPNNVDLIEPRRPRKRDFFAAAVALVIVATILFGAVAPFLY